MRIALATSLILLAACGPSVQPGEEESSVTLEAEPAAVAPGDSVVLTLTNRAAGTVGYNLCSSGLEVREGSAWAAVPSERVCTMELRMLEPGRAATYSIDLTAGLEPGEYRFVTTVEHLDRGDRVRVPGNSFTVGR